MNSVPAPAPVARRLGWGTLAAFGLPAAGYSFYLFFVQFYFLKFATDVLLLAPAVIGALFGAGRIWDALSDPLAGYGSDRTRTRLGRRRPWMLAALPLLAASFAMLWHPPVHLDAAALTVWSGLALFAFFTAFTIYAVPHLALGAELSSDHHERSRVFGLQRMAFIGGMMLAFAGIQYTANAPEERAAAGEVAVVAIALATALLLIPPLAMRERRESLGRGAASPRAAARDVLHNRHARVLLSVWFIESLGGGVLGVLAPYVTEYIMHRPDLIGVVPAFFIVPSVMAIPVWVLLSRRFGKKRVWLIAMVGTGLSFGATGFVPEDGLATLCGLLVLAGAMFGCGGAIGQSILADVIDYDEAESGERKEGAYAAAWGFALKLAIGMVIVLTGAVLQLAGFAPNAEQTEGARLTLRWLFAGMPCAGFLLGACVFRRFGLDAREHARIQAALRGRRGEASR